MAKSLKIGLLVAIPLLLATCKKEPVKTSDPPTDPPTVEIILSKDSVRSGDSLDVRIVLGKNTQMGACLIKNGKSFTYSMTQGPFDKTFNTSIMFFSDTLYCFIRDNDQVKPIKVYENPNDALRSKLLTKKPWVITDSEVLFLDGTLFSHSGLVGSTQTFYPNHRMKYLLDAKYGWALSGNRLLIGPNGFMKIMTRDSVAVLNDTELILYRSFLIDSTMGITGTPKPGWLRTTCHH